ncbi:hypothetical protein HHI36_009551 [Cryptolaemus montrouzieri]|uniref:Cytochrome P450 n=1 Tax=Cryptolaemus montrouzieri TaxID=559131 RepID=A0ABD2MG13_9CUCU
MYVFVSLLVVLFTIYFTWYLKKQVYIRKCLSKFPGPPKVFFFGNALDFLGDRGMLDVFREYQLKYGDVTYVRLGPNINSMVFTSAEFAKTIFLSNTNLTKGDAYEHIQCWLGEGLLTTDEQKWSTQRKMMMPAFNSQLLTDFISVFDRVSNKLIEKISSMTPIDSVNVHPIISLCTLDIICETTMGVSLNAQENQNVDYTKSCKEMCRITAVRSMSVWKSIKLLYIFSEDYRKQRKALSILHAYTDKVIAERKNLREDMKKNETMKQNDEPPRKKALLDILLDYSENEKILSFDEIRQEVHTFMFAGHDTVTATMDFFIYEIAKYPDIQNFIHEEQTSIFGSNIERETTWKDISEMKYLEQVIKETLRMYPPVPVYTRQVTKEFTYDGKIVPEGSFLIHFAYGLHRNEKYFPNPDVFDPTRFEDSEAIIPHSFLPFSTGPRNCIGQKFAMYEMKVILSKLIRNFKFLPAEPEHTLDVKAEVVLQSKTGINVKIIRRVK